MDDKTSLNDNLGIIKAIAEMFMNADSTNEFTLTPEAAHRIGFILYDAQKAIYENYQK